jgi:hypothetical protein
MKISSKKLADLHEYFTNGGSTDPEDVAVQLETENEAVVEAYVNSLKRKYPDVYGEDDASDIDPPSDKYVLVDQDTGLAKNLEVIKEKNGRVFLQVIEPKELVSIRVGGEEIEVDLIKLRKKAPTDKLGPHLVSTLIVAAELAKG